MAQGSAEQHPLRCPPHPPERALAAGRSQAHPLAGSLGSAGLSPAPALPKAAAPRQTQLEVVGMAAVVSGEPGVQP